VNRLKRFFAGEGKTVVKLLAYGAVCLGVLFYLISLIGNVHLFSHDVTYKATMRDVTGLLRNDSVKVAGVAVGKVTDITTERGKAVVTFKVKRDVKLRTGSQVGVRWRNVLGQKYLYVFPGSSGRILESGQRLPVSQSIGQADVGDFLNAVGPILKAIDPEDVNAFVNALMQALQGNEAKVGNLIGNTAAVSDTLGSLDTKTGRVIENLDQVVGAVAERDAALDQTVSNLASLSQTLAQNNDALQGLVTNFAAVQAQLRQLLTEHRGDIDTTVANLQTIAGVLSQHRADLEKGLSTLSSGLAPYHLISSYGQWFQVRAVIVCLANQASCSSETVVTDVISPRTASAGTAASVRRGPSVADITGFAAGGRTL
jgi:phospholipid/cholesterol/gamma-HCH transport system substrate-binding protein